MDAVWFVILLALNGGHIGYMVSPPIATFAECEVHKEKLEKTLETAKATATEENKGFAVSVTDTAVLCMQDAAPAASEVPEVPEVPAEPESK